MGGPGASILLRSAPTADDRSRFLADLAEVATSIRDNDFSIGYEHPFCFTLGNGRDDDFDDDDDLYGEDYPDELESIADSGLPTVLGWRPQGILMFCALCNGPRDHELLAELCIRYAERLDGIIDFHGELFIGPSLSGPSRAPACRVDAPGGLPGVLYAATYLAVSRTYATSHYSDAAFLRAFLHHPRFHMSK